MKISTLAGSRMLAKNLLITPRNVTALRSVPSPTVLRGQKEHLSEEVGLGRQETVAGSQS